MRLIEVIYITIMFIVINNSTQVDSNSECGTTEKSKSGIDIEMNYLISIRII